jgi:pimeloyl-ACP methyl ester carboxylesterase
MIGHMLTLADGRQLDIAVSGPESGVPLVFHHGTPGSVVQFGPLSSACADRGLRLVTYSRAGYGSSTRRAGRRVVDVVEDVQAILDSIGAPRCVVAGWSGGGPHALACGARLADRVAGVLSIASVAPYGAPDLDYLAGMGADNIEEFGLALEGEAALRPYLDLEAGVLRAAHVEGVIDALSTLLPQVDCDALRAGLGGYIVDQFHGAATVSAEGWLDDDLAFVAPWGFDLDEITVPTFLWQGSLDLMVPFAHGEWLAQHIAGVTAHLVPDQGHLSIFAGAMNQMLDELGSVV